ncbi:hypothetical protein, partial [Klebsiella pneumoniae]
AHEKGLEALAGLGIPAILSSRPVRAEGLLVNEAVAIENSVVRPVHRKHYFPEEPGWYEASWYVPGSDGFT